jgi:hypothetical protein
MATYTLVPLPRIGIIPEAGMLIYTYSAGGATPAATYQDSNGSATNTNPVQADGLGLFPSIYLPLGTSYKFICMHANGVTIWTQDGIASVPASSPAVDITGTAGEPIVANANVYLSDGSGGKTAGLWYNADKANAYSSVTPYTGFSTIAISTGMSGLIRMQGSLGGFVSLTAGAVYFVGTAGVPTTTPGVNRRVVGQADTTTSLMVGGNPPTVAQPFLNEFRLTLTTGVPYLPGDVTAATTLFCTPSGFGNHLTLFDAAGTPTTVQSAEFSIAIPATTATVYSVFIFLNAGVPALELAAWTNDTTPGTAAFSISSTIGVETKTGDLTRLYVGLMRTTGSSGQTESSALKRYVWNKYNQTVLPMRFLLATDSYQYTTATFRQMEGIATNQLDYVIGAAGRLIESFVQTTAKNDQALGTVFVIVAIGEDSTTTPSVNCIRPQVYTWTANILGTVMASLKTVPAIGRHTLVPLEYSSAAGTTTWYGDNGAALMQTGIHGSYWG